MLKRDLSFERLIRRLEARGQFRIKPGLERVQHLLRLLGNPQDRFPSIHVAGTNGKGSVVSSLEAVYRRSGVRTGLYTSPHLIDVRERIRVAGEPIAKVSFERFARDILHEEQRTGVQLTYFEFLTVLAFLAFRASGVELAVIETGLGGLWDATNVLRRPLACVITSIGLDHTEWLGKTRTVIAAQKAGIIKPGVPTISGVQGAAAKVIERAARQRQTSFYRLGKEFLVRPGLLAWSSRKQAFSFEWAGRRKTFWSSALLGRHQASNAGLVIATVELINKTGSLKVSEQDLRRGLLEVRWPGRFDYLKRPQGPAVLLDGAHNPEAIQVLCRTIKDSPLKTKSKSFVFSSFRDKNFRQMLQLLASFDAPFYFCELPSLRAAPLPALLQTARRLNLQYQGFGSPGEALQKALSETRADGVVVVVGSLTLIGDCLSKLQKENTACALSSRHVREAAHA
jgi:dihydrofolate synthase / folylpolyglutamate synthase